MGEFAQLIFSIDTGDPEDPIAVERMWVIVRERFAGGYLGILNNNPVSIMENEFFWSGIELPFSAKHIIDIRASNDTSMRIAEAKPTRPWPRS